MGRAWPLGEGEKHDTQLEWVSNLISGKTFKDHDSFPFSFPRFWGTLLIWRQLLICVFSTLWLAEKWHFLQLFSCLPSFERTGNGSSIETIHFRSRVPSASLMIHLSTKDVNIGIWGEGWSPPRLKNPKIRDEYTHAWLPYIRLLFLGFSNVYHCACVWPTALKFGSITNFDMLFLVMGFISLIDEIQFMLISSRHICIWSRFASTCAARAFGATSAS